MQRWFVSLVFASVFTVGTASAQVEIKIQVQAGQAVQVQAIQNAADRVALVPSVGYNQNQMMKADAIFVGRVVALEPMDVEVVPAPGQAKVTYRIAVVQVSEAIHGVKKGTQTVRVGFIANANNGPNGAIGGGIGNVQILPAIQPVPPGGFGGRRPFPGNIQMNLQVGQDGLFAITKHQKENFYLAPNAGTFIQRENNANFDNEVRTAKQLSKALADPVAALKAEDKDDRYVAAAVLITKYRSNPTGAATKTEPIDAEESKLILQALAGGDWTPNRSNANVPNPLELFNQLGVTPQDGYTAGTARTQQAIASAMQKWLDENNGKYRIQKLVADPNGQVLPGQVDPAPAVQPGIRPAIKLKLGNIKAQPIKGKVQILPVPAPAPAPIPAPPIELDREVAPAQPALPIRRE